MSKGGTGPRSDSRMGHTQMYGAIICRILRKTSRLVEVPKSGWDNSEIYIYIYCKRNVVFNKNKIFLCIIQSVKTICSINVKS